MKIGLKFSENNQENNPEKSYTRKVDEQTACGYSIFTEYLFNATEIKKWLLSK